MGFTEILTIIFIILKLLGVITWAWWVCLLPEIIAGVFFFLRHCGSSTVGGNS